MKIKDKKVNHYYKCSRCNGTGRETDPPGTMYNDKKPGPGKCKHCNSGLRR